MKNSPKLSLLPLLIRSTGYLRIRKYGIFPVGAGAPVDPWVMHWATDLADQV